MEWVKHGSTISYIKKVKILAKNVNIILGQFNRSKGPKRQTVIFFLNYSYHIWNIVLNSRHHEKNTEILTVLVGHIILTQNGLSEFH